MTHIDDRIDHAIRQWHDALEVSERVLDALNVAIDCAPESPLHQAVWTLAGGWQQAIAAMDDTGCTEEWLEWWWMECRLGERPLEASCGDDRGLRRIATIGDLVELARSHRVLERARG